MTPHFCFITSNGLDQKSYYAQVFLNPPCGHTSFTHVHQYVQQHCVPPPRHKAECPQQTFTIDFHTYISWFETFKNASRMCCIVLISQLFETLHHCSIECSQPAVLVGPIVVEVVTACSTKLQP